MANLRHTIGSMGHGDHLDIDSGDAKFGVDYHSEQAMGDNGQPAKGYTVGSFGVSGPGESDYASFRHTPQGPTLGYAKGYAADQAAQHISSQLFNDRRSEGRRMSGGSDGGIGDKKLQRDMDAYLKDTPGR